VLSSTQASGKWPSVKVSINNDELFDGPVCQTQLIKYAGQSSVGQKEIIFKIEYYNKSDSDTVVENGVIKENQSVLIDQLKINTVDVIKTGLIHKLGSYQMDLSQEKLKYFIKNNIDTSTSTNTHMYENGVWTINLELPILSFFTKKFDYQESWEKIDIVELTNKIYQQFLICKSI
jgi:hypothetical protein